MSFVYHVLKTTTYLLHATNFIYVLKVCRTAEGLSSSCRSGRALPSRFTKEGEIDNCRWILVYSLNVLIPMSHGLTGVVGFHNV